MDIGATNQVNVQSQTANAQSVGSAQDRSELVKAVQSINQSGLWPGRDLVVRLDPGTQRFTVQVLNSVTRDVLEQIPSEEALRMAAELSSSESVTPATRPSVKLTQE